jgi:RimJ/RimL family protein N-acetyltransferase
VTTIATPRLILRRYTHADIPDILAFAAHPSVSRATPEIKATEAGVKHYIDQQNACQPFEMGKCFDLAIELKEEKRVIGLVSAVRREHEQMEIGYALAVEYRGQGLATEAAEALVAYGFDILKLHRISARTGKHNTRSWRLMERIGMHREAHLRESHQVNGEWDDEFIYAILAGEWKETRGESEGLAHPPNRP